MARKTRSNKNGIHIMLKPVPCSIKKLLKTSKNGKIFTYRRTVSGKRYKQYCKNIEQQTKQLLNVKPAEKAINKAKSNNTEQQTKQLLNVKPAEKASLFKVGSIMQGYKVITVRKGSGRKKQWKKL